jgi:hypothetical protein
MQKQENYSGREYVAIVVPPNSPEGFAFHAEPSAADASSPLVGRELRNAHLEHTIEAIMAEERRYHEDDPLRDELAALRRRIATALSSSRSNRQS